MKLNNKGFALTSIIYMLIVLFLMIMLLILSNLATRKVVLDKVKYDVKVKLGQGGLTSTTPDLPYQNLTTGIYYENLEVAFNKANSGDTIKVLKNVEDVSKPNLAEGKTANLDLNGYTVTMSQSITNNGTLTVSGSGELTNSTVSNITNTVTGIFTKSGTSTISNTSTSSYHIINNQGLATFSEGNVTAGYRAINNQNTGRLVISGANIIANDMAIYNAGRASTVSEPSVLISDGTITSSLKQGVSNASTGMVYMSGGVVTSNGANTYGIQNSSGGTVTVTGGTINAAYRCIRNSSTSTLTIEGGTFSAVGVSENTYSTQTLSLAGGTINVSGGTFNVNKGSSASSVIVELENNTTQIVTITGGTFTSDNGGIAVNGAGTLEISGTTSITAVTNGISNVRTGTVNIKGGTITSTNGFGVKNSNASGTITIGLDDSNVSTTSPVITGKTYGVQIQAGTFNFYDGKLIGQSGSGSSISGTVVTPTGYTRKTILNGTTETTTLGWATDSDDTQLVNDTTEYHVSRTSSDAANKVIKQYTINAPFAANEVYQLEYDIKGSGTMHTYFYGASGYWQVATTERLGGTTTTGSDGASIIALPNEYTHSEIRFTLRPTGNANVNKYLLFRLNSGNADAYVKNIKFYKINSANITINPNGGTYNGSTSTQNFSEKIGNKVNIATPTRTGYTFGGWLPTKDEYDATWAEVFYHNNRTGTVLFSNASDWAEAKSTDSVYKYSILGQLEKFRTNTSSTFEFLLDYDELAGKYNRWRQTANPVTTTVANGTGSENAPGYTTNFTGSHIDWTGSYWGGLTRSTNSGTFINGSVGHANWFYAIGAKQIWGSGNPGIPGPSNTNINGGIHLWVKVNNDLSNITQQVTGVVLNGSYTVKHDITLKAIWIPN